MKNAVEPGNGKLDALLAGYMKDPSHAGILEPGEPTMSVWLEEDEFGAEDVAPV